MKINVWTWKLYHHPVKYTIRSFASRMDTIYISPFPILGWRKSQQMTEYVNVTLVYWSWLRDGICRREYGSTSARTMSWCCQATHHYPKYRSLTVSDILLGSSQANFKGNVPQIYPWHEFENYKSMVTAASHKGQWVQYVHSQLSQIKWFC